MKTENMKTVLVTFLSAVLIASPLFAGQTSDPAAQTGGTPTRVKVVAPAPPTNPNPQATQPRTPQTARQVAQPLQVAQFNRPRQTPPRPVINVRTSNYNFTQNTGGTTLVLEGNIRNYNPQRHRFNLTFCDNGGRNCEGDPSPTDYQAQVNITSTGNFRVTVHIARVESWFLSHHKVPYLRVTGPNAPPPYRVGLPNVTNPGPPPTIKHTAGVWNSADKSAGVTARLENFDRAKYAVVFRLRTTGTHPKRPYNMYYNPMLTFNVSPDGKNLTFHWRTYPHFSLRDELYAEVVDLSNLSIVRSQEITIR